MWCRHDGLNGLCLHLIYLCFVLENLLPDVKLQQLYAEILNNLKVSLYKILVLQYLATKVNTKLSVYERFSLFWGRKSGTFQRVKLFLLLESDYMLFKFVGFVS